MVLHKSVRLIFRYLEMTDDVDSWGLLIIFAEGNRNDEGYNEKEIANTNRHVINNYNKLLQQNGDLTLNNKVKLYAKVAGESTI